MKGRSVLLAIVVLSCQFALNRTAAAQQQNRPPAAAVAEFERNAWRIQEGKLRIISDIDPEQSRRTFDRTRWLLNTIEQVFSGMAVRRPSDGLEVWYVKERPTYLAMLDARAGVDGTNTGGMAISGGRRTMLFSRGLEWKTIQHEAWHASCSVFIPGMPKWLNEGIAEVFSHGVFLEDQFVIGGIDANDIARVKALFETDNWVPLARFIHEDDDWNQRVREGTIRGRAQYVQAWAICHFLLFADDGQHRQRLNTLLRGLNRGMDEWKAFDAAIGANEKSAAALDAEIRTFFENARPVDLADTHRQLATWADTMVPKIPLRGRVDPETTGESLAAWLGRSELGKKARNVGDSITVKSGRSGRGPVIDIDPMDGLRWEVRFERNRDRRGNRDDSADEPPAWIPAIRWSLSE